MSNKKKLGPLALGALGVVFGDIGTSPLYTFQEIFTGPHHPQLIKADVLGALSLVFWTLMVVVSFKYVLFVMRADNQGEGGIMALISLVRRVSMKTARTKYILVALGVFGASLFYGDALITPAISVLGAVEGLEVINPSFKHLIVPISVTILVALFLVQRLGTRAVGLAFGPVMAVWFSVIAVLGASQIAQHPGVLQALSPSYGIDYFIRHGLPGFLILGAVVLAVTGAEALYADMGHFGKRPIAAAWFWLVLPSLALNYFGQGAEVLYKPKTLTNPFFYMAPGWASTPLVILATLAAVIASQAVISGAFSMTSQAVRLGFLPLLRVKHTNDEEIGQVYLPKVNTLLMILVVCLVLGFQSAGRLASAYGMAVTGTMLITTVLALVVAHSSWKTKPWELILGGGALLLVDVSLFGSNLAKFLRGGWFPISIAVIMFLILMTWQRGRVLLTRNRVALEGPLQEFVDLLAIAPHPPIRTPGTAVFLNADRDSTPLALRLNIEHNGVLKENVIIVTVETLQIPHVSEDKRVEVDTLKHQDDGIARVIARFGFSDIPDVPAALKKAADYGLCVDADYASYFITRSSIVPVKGNGMALWRKKLFVVMNRNSGNGTEYFRLPAKRVVALGSMIVI